MRDLFEFIKDASFPLLLIFGSLICAIFIVQYIDINYIDNIPIVVKVDGKTVYEGTSAGASVGSSGATTRVSIRGGFLYLFPKAYYVSHNVEVVGVKP